jgi:hypothetical protein
MNKCPTSKLRSVDSNYGEARVLSATIMIAVSSVFLLFQTVMIIVCIRTATSHTDSFITKCKCLSLLVLSYYCRYIGIATLVSPHWYRYVSSDSAAFCIVVLLGTKGISFERQHQ